MFQLVSNYISGAVGVAPPKDNFPFLMANNEAAVAGCPYQFAAGRLTICGDDDVPHVMVVENAAAGVDVAVRGYWITPGMVFKVPYVGVAAPTFLPGLATAETDGGGNLDAAAVVDGCWSILRLNTADAIAYVTANASLFH